MGSRRTSDPRFFDRDATCEFEVPEEWAPGWVVFDVPTAEWEGLRVELDGEALAVQLRRLWPGHPPSVACEWPKVNAGHHRLRVRTSEDGVRDFTLRVAPTKLTSGAFSVLLEDLTERLPTEVALGLQRGGALAGVPLVPPNERTYAGERARLRRAITGSEGQRGLPALVREITRRPHRVLTNEPSWTPAERARRPQATGLREALVRPGNAGVGGALRAVIDGRARHSFDTYENQLAKTFLEEVRGRAASFLRCCEATARARHDVEEAREWVRSLDSARAEAPWIEEVSRLNASPSRLSMVLLKTPAYRETLEARLAFHRSSGVRLESDALLAPLESLPALYQLWGTLQVLVVLLDAATEARFRVVSQRLVRPQAGTSYVRVLPDGAAAVELVDDRGIHVRFIPERTYTRRSIVGLKSASFEQRPDVSIEVERDGRASVWIFDPKYKLSAGPGEEGFGKPVKADVDKMHAYRDAIRDSDGRQVVQFASTLYPGESVWFGNEVAALRAYPGDEAALRRELEGVLRHALAQ